MIEEKFEQAEILFQNTLVEIQEKFEEDIEL